MMNSSPNESNQSDKSKKLKLSDFQRDVLTGCLLGDAHLEWSANRQTARIKFEQSDKHAGYLWHLYQIFKPFVTAPPSERVHHPDTKVVSLRFQTIKHSCFRFYGHQFTARDQKTVPRLIHRWLNPCVFAYWFMDDGSIKSKQSKGVILNTHGFTKPEIVRLIEALKSKLFLEASIRSQTDGNQIYISGKSYERLVEILDPWVIESMRYKIPPPRRT
jgi:hypothetical protein